MSKTILVIDDDESNVKYLSALLGENGYAVESAPDGLEGLEKAMENKPDLIVLDIMMPKKSGFGTFSSLKKNDGLKDIPVIMVTAFTDVIEKSSTKSDDEDFEGMKDFFLDKMEKLVDKYRNTGKIRPDEFFDKPIDPEKFMEAVESLINK